MEKGLYLTDLVDVEVLQRIQDAFAALTGMASLTTDVDGVPVTKGSNFTEFCTDYIRQTKIGHSRCEQCDKYGAHATWENGKPTTYYCHAGLTDYAAPIIADGTLVGCFIGGQVLDKKPDYEQIKKVAEDIGVDPEELFQAAQKVHILDKERINNAARFLCVIANTLSDMAYGKYLALQANKEYERASNMKSDFLANMSHEIRTPMNAVIGMAEMALREELPPAARDHINQIKISGNALLTIINDILDFSKIESGKMDIIPVEYEPMSIINDVCNILTTRLKDKKVELILDISPNIPHKLFGDNNRIKQILLNIANNAIKFTSHGKVVIHMSHSILSDQEIRLCISVEDTGSGIKEEDLGKLFQSFQQLDSKRNRNIEGTGLGLAISHQLLTLMNGEIHVESQYEKGSIFSFSLPQKVVDASDCLQVKDPQTVTAVALIENPYIREQLKTDCGYLGVEYRTFVSREALSALAASKNVFLFIEKSMFQRELEEYIKKEPPITAILLINYNDTAKYYLSRMLYVKKPLYTLNETLIFNKESLYYHERNSGNTELDFTAPEARVLIVDDNAVNLTVAESLLEPLKMQIDTALSGQKAIDMISSRHYDIVFMDHMMPELDGIETTHIIRRFHKEYESIPIIALTANAVGGMQDMFLDEGMDDFIAKPIEFRTLISKVKKWLPAEKIQKPDNPENPAGNRKQAKEMATGGLDTGSAASLLNPDQEIAISDSNTEASVGSFGSDQEITIGDLDTESAIGLLGSEKIFWNVLKEYYRIIDKKSRLIRELMEKEDWTGYTIEVHALKSASRQVGAVSLSEKAAAMEKAGNAKDAEKIRSCTDDMLRQYQGYQAVLEPLFTEKQDQDSGKAGILPDKLFEIFVSMHEALDNLNLDNMDLLMSEMKQYHYDGWQEELLGQLQNAVDEIDMDACEDIISHWEEQL